MATSDDPPDDDQVTLPSMPAAPKSPPAAPDPGFPEPEVGDLVRRGCCLMAAAFVIACIVLALRTR